MEKDMSGMNVLNEELDKTVLRIFALIDDDDKNCAIMAGIDSFVDEYCKTNEICVSMASVIKLNKCRSILYNIDPDSRSNNDVLLNKIKKGRIDIHQIPFMPPSVIHPLRWANEIAKKRVFDEQEGKVITSNLYKCRKCKDNKCTAIQLQLRSADEPMTNIVTCTSCSYSWRC